MTNLTESPAKAVISSANNTLNEIKANIDSIASSDELPFLADETLRACFDDEPLDVFNLDDESLDVFDLHDEEITHDDLLQFAITNRIISEPLSLKPAIPANGSGGTTSC